MSSPSTPSSPPATPPTTSEQCEPSKLIYELKYGDCMTQMTDINPQSVDLVLNDPPYGCTAHEWDKTGFNLDACWEQYQRILKPNGIVILFACSDANEESFLARVLNSKPRGWKLYTLVWEKAKQSSGALSDKRPLRYHEDIVVFYRGTHTYHPQMREANKKAVVSQFGGKERFPRSITPVFKMERGAHPTQKPVKLLEWLIKSYSNVGDVVLDNTMGSGSTGVACVNTHRSFAGIEMDETYYNTAKERIEKARLKQLVEPTEEDEGAENALLGTDVELPPLQNQLSFEPRNFMSFYKNLPFSDLDEEEVEVAVVRYLNQYFCAVLGKELKYVEVAYKHRLSSAQPIVETEFIVRSPAETKRRLMKCRIQDGEKMKNAFDMWSIHVDSREYESMKFDPTGESSSRKVLNYFPGLQVVDYIGNKEEFDSQKVDVILKHLKALAGDDNLSYDYFLDWLAYPIQTGEKTNVALLVKGQPGCGKGLVFETLLCELIYGKLLAVQLSGGKQLNEKFNGAWKKKMLVVIDEPASLNTTQRDNLKQLITAHSTVVGEKFMSDTFQDDYTNYAFTCNHVPPEFLEHDDRRFFVLQHNGKNVRDGEYFKVLRNVIIDQKGYEDFYLFLKKRDICVFKKGEAPPHTRLKERLCVENVDPIFRYFRHLCDADTLPQQKPFSEIFDDALKWCSEERIKVSWVKDSLKLKKIIREKLPDIQVDKVAGVMGSPGKTARTFFFPSKEQFVEMMVNANVYLKKEEHEAEEIKVEESSQQYEEWDELVDYDDVILEAEQDELRNKLEQCEFNRTELPDIHFDHE